MGIEGFKGPEQQVISTKEEHGFTNETIESKMVRKYQERVDETFGDLDNKKFKSGDSIDFMCMTKEGKKVDCKFDIENQKLTYDNIGINISMPSGAKIKEILFNNQTITIKGQLGFFTGSGSANYIDLLKAIDLVVEKGNSEIATKGGIIGFSKI